MEKNNFWADVLKYGAIIGVVAVVFDLLGMYRQNMMLSLGSLVAFLMMAYYFTRRRVVLYSTPEEGYSYGRCLGYIVCMMLVAGLIEGVYMALATNWLFVEQYEKVIGTTVATLESTGFYTPDMLEMVVKMMHSPIFLIFSGIFSAVVKGAFFGLFIAAMTRRQPDIFAEDKEE